jgi:hypothetical protein
MGGTLHRSDSAQDDELPLQRTTRKGIFITFLANLCVCVSYFGVGTANMIRDQRCCNRVERHDPKLMHCTGKVWVCKTKSCH